MLKNMLLKNMFKNKRRWTEDTDFPICAICSTEYEPSFDNVTILFNCYHKFHTTCLEKYIEERQVVLTERETEAFRWVGKPLPTQEDLDYIADNIECPSCNTTFSVYDLVYDNYKSANIWPINPNAPIPELSEAPEDLNDILIFKNILGANGNSPSIEYYSINHSAPMYGPDGLDDPNDYYSYYKENLGPQCPLPHILPHIEIPQLTDPLEFIEMQYKTAIINNDIAINDYSNAREYSTNFFERFLQSKGITMSDFDIAYNKAMKRIAHDRLVETERVKTTIKQILDNAKTLLGQFKSALQSIRKSVSKRVKKSIKKAKQLKNRLLMRKVDKDLELLGGKHKKSKKSKKHKKHKNYKKHNKSRKPRKK
jgi:DNA-binding protein H-NS